MLESNPSKNVTYIKAAGTHWACQHIGHSGTNGIQTLGMPTHWAYQRPGTLGMPEHWAFRNIGHSGTLGIPEHWAFWNIGHFGM